MSWNEPASRLLPHHGENRVNLVILPGHKTSMLNRMFSVGTLDGYEQHEIWLDG